MVCNNLKECVQNKGLKCERRGECIEFSDKRPEATCTEKGKRYNLINDKGCLVTQYHVDGGIVYDDRAVPRCDYLYVIDDAQMPTAIFVELKGKDIRHAVEQIEQSVNRFGNCIRGRMFARIVCSAVPRLYNDPSVKKLKNVLRSRNEGNLVISSSKNYEEKYSSM